MDFQTYVLQMWDKGEIIYLYNLYKDKVANINYCFNNINPWYHRFNHENSQKISAW